MNWEKYNMLLEKLNNLHSHLEKYEEVSDAEKDLMMSYLRSMHNVLAEGRDEVNEIKAQVISNGNGHKTEVIDETVHAQEEMEIEEIAEVEIEEVELDPALLELFADQEAVELSDKLKMLPITDLTKSMSINEKALAINELFGGDADLYTKTIHNLNILASYDEAKEFLINGVAAEQGWAESGKTKKAVHKWRRGLRKQYENYTSLLSL